MTSTEYRDPRFKEIDRWPTIEAVEAMLEGQIEALEAVRLTTEKIASAAEAAAQRLMSGGRLIYAGAGTSGRVAVQDGVELGPTFGWPKSRLDYFLAGGIAALSHSAEGAEDDETAGREAVLAGRVGKSDVVVGVAASGRTPYTCSVIEASKASGGLTIAIANNPDTRLLRAADHGLLVTTGSEIIAGSTRMKAGTAQKAVLNMMSTAIMLRLGRIYKGLMVDMQISNDKLLSRAHDMVVSLTGCSDDSAAQALTLAQNDIKLAVLVATGLPLDEAQGRLHANNGILRLAIEASGDRIS